MIETTCYFCKLKIRVPAKIYPPFICACGEHLPIPEGVEVVDVAVVSPPESRPCCIYRGLVIGKLECNCGALYQCDRLAKMCSEKRPFDKMVMGIIQGVEGHVWLTDDNYQPCEACASMTPPD